MKPKIHEFSLEALVSFSEDIWVKNEVLGAEFSTKVGVYKANIVFPILDPNRDYDAMASIYYTGIDDTSLIGPSSINSRENIKWGYVTRFPTLDCVINHIVLKFTVKTDKTVREVVTEIEVLLSEFMSRFRNYLEYDTEAVFGKLTNNQFYKENISFSYTESENKFYYNFTNPIRIAITINKDSFLSFKQIEGAFNYASSKKQIRLEHLMIANARRYERNGKLNYAMLELSTSLELTLSHVLNLYFARRKQSELGDSLTEKKTLGTLLKLAEKTGIELIEIKLLNDFVRDRNKCMHSGAVPDQGIIKKYIVLISKITKKHITIFENQKPLLF